MLPSRTPARVAPLEVSVRPLAMGDVPATARLLADALRDDPAYCYLFADPETRAARFTDFFERNLRAHRRSGYVCIDVRGELCGTVTLRPPGGVHVSALSMIRRGLLPFALAHGVGAVARLLWLKHTYDELERTAASGRSHFHVHMMAIRPEMQRRGMGTLLLDRALTHAMASAPGVPAVLTTHFERNVAFYRRAGFQIASERVVCLPGTAPYGVWAMRLSGRTLPHPNPDQNRAAH